MSRDKGIASYTLNDYRHVLDPKDKTLVIKGDFYNNLKALSQKEGITLNAILQYAWHKILKVYGSDNSKSVVTVVGTTVSGRNLPIDGVEESVGLYINTLPLIVEHNKSENSASTIIESIRRLQNDITEINVRSNVNLSKLQKEGVRLFDTLFVFENYPIPVSKDGCQEREKELLDIEFKKAIEKLDYPLSVIGYEFGNSLIFTIKYYRN